MDTHRMRFSGKVLGAILLVPIMALALVATGCGRSSDSDPPGPIGACGAYQSYEGVAEVTRITELNPSQCYDGYEVMVRLSDNLSDRCAQVGDTFEPEWQLTLKNGWSPGPQFMEKYDIEVGAMFPVTLSVQASGPCSPCVLDFQTVDQADYFECE